MKFEIKKFNELTVDDMYEIAKSRFEVFVCEQEITEEQDFDDKDIRKEYLIENMKNLKKYYPDYQNDERYKHASMKKKLIYKLMEMNLMGVVLKIYDR